MVLVDNTFATPILQTPLEQGADIVMHSVTKALSGHSDLLMGALVARDADLAERLRIRRILLGAAPSAFDCYLALRGIRTVALRVERGQASAMTIAARLEEHPAVQRVRYPGFGTIAAIEPAGGVAAADAVCASVRVWTHATSLGGVESLLERRRRWPLEAATVPDSLIRLSFGIEGVEDLWADLAQALSARPVDGG
jgi:cystathionine gamma-synthase